MNLCDACARFARAISQKAKIKDAYFNDPRKVLQQQHECSFCKWLLACSFHGDILDETYPSLHSIISTHEMFFGAAKNHIMYSFWPPDCRSTFEISAPSGSYTLHLFFAAQAESAAAARGWPLISNLLSPEDTTRDGYFGTVKKWLDTCFSEHGDCEFTIAEEAVDELIGPELPTRILEISAGPIEPVIKLLQSRKQRGIYIALSPCWGPPEKHPLRTTKANLQSHLEGISLQSLPRTFLDAIELSQSLGIQYLWIDSLCIIQDDEQDWKNEAAGMGTIFENASLVISGGAAEESSQGLLSRIRRRQGRVNIPYSTGNNKMQQGSQENLLVEEFFDCSPLWGTLRSRGWIVQERYLSRRQVSFTRGGMAWKCRMECMDQFGNSVDDLQYPHWFSILSDYSRCELTYASDRLIALEGLARRLKKTRLDNYSFGIWHTRAVLHILWHRFEFGLPSDDLPHLPSWTWAAWSGEKAFWAHGFMFNHVRTDGHDAALMTITDAGIMKIRKTPIISCRTWSRPDRCPTAVGPRLTERYFKGMRMDPLRYIYTLKNDVEVLVGVAALDEDRDCSLSARCISLMRWEPSSQFLEEARENIQQSSSEIHPTKYDDLERAGKRGSFHKTESGIDNVKGDEIESLQEPLDDKREDKTSREGASDEDSSYSETDTQVSGHKASDEHEKGLTDISGPEEEHELWHVVLMLEPISEGNNQYERVGLGIIPDSYWKKANVTYQEVTLV